MRGWLLERLLSLNDSRLAFRKALALRHTRRAGKVGVGIAVGKQSGDGGSSSFLMSFEYGVDA